MLELKAGFEGVTLPLTEKASHAMLQSRPGSVAGLEQPSSMYVYLTSGAMKIVPAITHVTLTDSRMLLLRDELTVADYPRDSVYFASRQRECPPAP